MIIVSGIFRKVRVGNYQLFKYKFNWRINLYRVAGSMNRLKAKENLNPNLQQLNKQEENKAVKSRNQSKPPLNENTNNPQKSTKKAIKQKQDPKPDLKPPKSATEKLRIAAEIHYEQQILNYVTELSTTNFKKNKLLEQNKTYRAYRQNLLEAVYRECISFKLKHSTFFLYVYFIDSFMKTPQGRKLNLQNNINASYACFLMAQKYEEIYPPSIFEWLPENIHEEVYKWEGKIIFALNFKLIHESMFYFFQYWAHKFQLSKDQRKTCVTLLESILWNQDLIEKYEPEKISKAVVIAQLKGKKQKQIDTLDPFESASEKKKIISDIAKHTENAKNRIDWIQNLKK